MNFPAKLRKLGMRFMMLDNMLVVFGYAIVFPLISAHFVLQRGWSAGAVAAALAIRQLIQEGCGIWSGSMAQRLGAKPMIVSGMLLRAGSFLLLALAQNLVTLMISCVLAAVGGLFFSPSRGALFVKLTRPEERSRYFAILMMQDGVTGAAASAIGGYLIVRSFYWVCFVGAAAYGLAAVVNHRFLPAYKTGKSTLSTSGALSEIVRDRRFFAFVILLSGYYILGVQISMLIPIELSRRTGSISQAGLAYTLRVAIVLSLTYPLAKIAGKRFSEFSRFMFGFFIMIFCMLLVPITSSGEAFIILLMIFFLGNVLADPAREAIIGNLANSSLLANYMGFSRIGLAIGGALGFLTSGVLVDLSRSHDTYWLPWVVISCIALCCWLGLLIGTGSAGFSIRRACRTSN
ncbi:MFS transporter [Burkholderia glumae]|uniref:MFS transporter n=1 Tax=Burkholderia glumae TaxID=337 RepID=UPI00039B713F|nr:MFS transporter [Burkholderia glumae]